MSSVFAFFVAIITSFITYRFVEAKITVDTQSILKATQSLLEWIGAFAIFVVANLLLGVTVILLTRSLTQRFVTMYDLENPWFLILSAAQAFIFQIVCSSDRRTR